ncbi:MAG TPA: PTPDL family protein [Luteolibacter sp.]|nr:PTPDL family protein [Luteolibacter sp.]
MKPCLIPLAIALLALAPHVMAETLVLKDGTEIEGTILRETDDSYVVEVPFSRSIKEERVVPKDQVARIRRAQPDLVAFEAIEELVPAPDMLDAAGYGRRIESIENFLKQHRQSAKYGDAKKMLGVLKSEANEIHAGGIKLGGRIIPAEEYRANRLEIDARIEESRIRALIDEGDLLSALRKFSSFEADFRGTEPYHDLLSLIQRAIRSHLAQTEAMLAAHDKRVAEREAGLQRMAMEERRITQGAIEEENRALEARFKAEKDARIGWVTVDPYFKPAMTETLNFGRRELDRLSAAASATTPDLGELYREALKKVRSGADDAKASIDKARTARMPEKYLAILQAAAK